MVNEIIDKYKRNLSLSDRIQLKKLLKKRLECHDFEHFFVDEIQHTTKIHLFFLQVPYPVKVPYDR